VLLAAALTDFTLIQLPLQRHAGGAAPSEAEWVLQAGSGAVGRAAGGPLLPLPKRPPALAHLRGQLLESFDRGFAAVYAHRGAETTPGRLNSSSVGGPRPTAGVHDAQQRRMGCEKPAGNEPVGLDRKIRRKTLSAVEWLPILVGAGQTRGRGDALGIRSPRQDGMPTARFRCQLCKAAAPAATSALLSLFEPPSPPCSVSKSVCLSAHADYRYECVHAGGRWRWRGGAPASENTGGGGRQKNCLQCTAAKWQRRATRKHGLFSPAALLGRMNELVGWGGST
jgi:hypothetical protein